MAAAGRVRNNDMWIESWKVGKTHWHLPGVHKGLMNYWDKIIKNLPENPKVFVPLCGKTVDMKWLYDKGCQVVGVEVSEQAAKEFFQEHDLSFETSQVSEFTLYKSKDEKIRLYIGDFYLFDKLDEKSFDLIWDRGSFVAINVDDREKYFSLIKSVNKSGGLNLLETFDYPPGQIDGPPHSISDDELAGFYVGDHYSLEPLEKPDIFDDPDMRDKLIEMGLKKGYIRLSLFTRL